LPLLLDDEEKSIRLFATFALWNRRRRRSFSHLQITHSRVVAHDAFS